MNLAAWSGRHLLEDGEKEGTLDRRQNQREFESEATVLGAIQHNNCVMNYTPVMPNSITTCNKTTSNCEMWQCF